MVEKFTKQCKPQRREIAGEGEYSVVLLMMNDETLDADAVGTSKR